MTIEQNVQFHHLAAPRKELEAAVIEGGSMHERVSA